MPVYVVNHNNQPQLRFSSFTLVLRDSLWLWLGRSFKLQSLIGLGLGLEKELEVIIIIVF